MKLPQSKAWWARLAEREGDSVVLAGAPKPTGEIGMGGLVERLRNILGPGDTPKCVAEAADRIEALERALDFYANAWETPVDAELTAAGWQGSIGDPEPSEALYRDRGDRARAALHSDGGR